VKERDLRSFILEEESRGNVVRITDEVSSKYQASSIIRKYDGNKVVVFENVDGKPFRLVANTIFGRDQLLRILGVKNHAEAYEKLLNACERPGDLLVDEIPGDLKVFKGTLHDLPILTYYEKDGGPYITAGIVVARDEDIGFQNMSIHRLLVIDDKHMAIRIVPRHLYLIYEKNKKKGRDLEIAIIVGVHPLILIAAASSPPYGVDEAKVAAKLMNRMAVFKSEVTGLLLPTKAEIIIEGRILADREEYEGPFVDITGTYDIVRRQPVIEVDRILVRGDKPIYQAILPAGTEHRLLMGFYREAKIWRAVRDVVPSVREVRLTPGGCGWLSCVISMVKKSEGDPKNAILAAFAAHPSLKIVVVVDEDIDVDNPVDVEWAIVTRMQPSEDLVIIPRIRGSSLDPSADQEKLLTSKLGIDATIPLDKPREHFIKVI